MNATLLFLSGLVLCGAPALDVNRDNAAGGAAMHSAAGAAPMHSAASVAAVHSAASVAEAYSARAEDAPAAPAVKAGSVTGRVAFDGKRPEPKTLSASAEQQKGCCPDGKGVNATDPTLVIDEKLGIANVLVTIDVPDAKVEAPKEPFVIDQHGCVFEPHCIIVPAGSKVVFKNSDKVTHNVRILAAKNDPANDVMTAGTQKEYTFAKPEKVRVGCDYHPWMSSLVLVVDTPFAALTAADGTFSIAGLKPGTYKVKLWHEVLGKGEGEAVVKDDGTCVPLALKMTEPKKK